MMTKAEMIAMANAWMADYENGVADMRPLEAMAEILLQSAKLDGYNTKEADRHADEYSYDFIPANLVAAMEALKKEVEAA